MAYSKGKITIPNVSGNIVISVTTKAIVKTNLFIKTPSKESTSTAEAPADMVYLGARLNTAHNVVRAGDGQLITRPIAASRGDVFSIKSDKSNGGNNYYANVYCYDGNGNYLGSIETHYTSQTWSWDSDYKNGTVTMLEGSTAADLSNLAYVRFCLAYTDIDNLEITK